MKLRESKWILYPLSRARKHLLDKGVPEEILIACDVAAQENPELFGVAVDIKTDDGSNQGIITQCFVMMNDLLNIWRPHPEFENIKNEMLSVYEGKYDVFSWEFDDVDVDLFNTITNTIIHNPDLPQNTRVAQTFALIWAVRFNNPIGDLKGMFIPNEFTQSVNHTFETGDPVKVILVGDQEVHGMVVGLLEKSNKAHLSIVTTQPVVVTHNKETLSLNVCDKFTAPLSSVQKYMSPVHGAV